MVNTPEQRRMGIRDNRDLAGGFEVSAQSIILATGGIGGNHDMVRKVWPVDRLGPPPARMIADVPDYVDGTMQTIARNAGAGVINEDRMWYYFERITNWNPIWPNHGIHILPGPSSVWLDALGKRMEAPCLPGFDTLSTLKRIRSTGYAHSRCILTQKIIEKEFALSGSEQNRDFTSGR
jgi:predicted oxidoreductase